MFLSRISRCLCLHFETHLPRSESRSGEAAMNFVVRKTEEELRNQPQVAWRGVDYLLFIYAMI